MVRINTTSSIKASVRGEVAKAIQSIEEMIDTGTSDVEKEAVPLVADTSRIIHALVVGSVEAGKDVILTLDHANGEVKRIVVGGTMTVEALINHLRGLTAKPGA